MVNEDFIYANNRINFYPFPKNQETLTPYEQKVVHSNGKVVWRQPVTRTDITGYHESVITAGRMLRSYHDFSHTIGAVFIYITKDSMSEILSNASFYENSLFLFSGDDELICEYSPDPSAIKHALGQTDITIDALSNALKQDYIVTSVTINSSGWKLISTLPNSAIQQDIQFLRQKIVTITLAILLSSFSFSFLFSHLHTKRIEKITRHIQEEAFTRLPLSTGPYYDEVSTLEQHYNTLIDKINTLLKEQFELGRKIEKTQYTLLCAQINPHFLYNTLDFINLLSIKKEIPEISEMIHNLAHFYKLSLNHGESDTTLIKEIEHITVYLNIQNQRFHKPVQFQNLIPTALWDTRLPNLLLQPIVENAILHGIYNGDWETGIIRLSAKQTSGTLIIILEDNGIGCDPEDLNRLLADSSQESRGYGLRNVHQRIQLTYGSGCGLSFDRSDLGGLKVMISIKISNKQP
ncbi:sensor histidine kinase [Hungatella effluvii]|uniref:sensor histidine kinase n=1 Tax=Hungatella effluvii TaxID=1096246 RepID=UPI002A82C23E|nr:histidine kinase [Hungatella effluvii]